MMRLALLAAAVSAAAVLIGPPSAAAGDTICAGVLIGGTYDNVVVPPGASCELFATTVIGNVTALENSQLQIFRSTIDGNVLGDKAEFVVVSASSVRENIEIKEGEVDDPGRDVLIVLTTVLEGNIKVEKMTGDVFIRANTRVLKGDVQVFENVIPATALLILDGLVIGENLQVFKNSGPGRKEVQNNTAGESIQCFENDPPFLGTLNIAPKIEGQCS